MAQVDEQGAYSAPATKHWFRGLLFDMDGTIIDSTEACVRHWHAIGKELDVDPEFILRTSHGRRTMDVLREVKPEKANWDYIKAKEGAMPGLYGDTAVEIPGARSLLSTIAEAKPAISWAIVTSGTSALVTAWLERLSLPEPSVLVTAESVVHGKPDPTCYNMAREALGLPATAELLVLEDSPAGIRAGKAAGCKVLGLVTSHTVEQVRQAEPDWIVKDLASVKVVAVDDGDGARGVQLEISGAWEAR